MSPCPYCARTDSHRHSVVIEGGKVAVDGEALSQQGSADKPCSTCGKELAFWYEGDGEEDDGVSGWRVPCPDCGYLAPEPTQPQPPESPTQGCGTCGGDGWMPGSKPCRDCKRGKEISNAARCKGCDACTEVPDRWGYCPGCRVFREAAAKEDGRLGACNGCGAFLRQENQTMADGCPCNSGRGINHGIIPALVCTCAICDPEQTGSSRFPRPDCTQSEPRQ